MPMVPKRFSGVTTRHSQKTAGASGTKKHGFAQRQDTAKHRESKAFLTQCFKPVTAKEVANG